MKRRTFIKYTSLISSAVFLPLAQLFGAKPKPKKSLTTFISDLPLQGSPFRKNCDSLDNYNDISFETMIEDIVHYRTPAKLRDKLILGIKTKDD